MILYSPETVSPAVRAQRATAFPWNRIFALLLALMVARLWLVPLASSFWVDELVTAFLVRFGSDHPSLAVAPQVPASIYYALPRLMDRLFGFSEVAYRIPSLLALAASLPFLYRLAVRLVHPAAGWFVLFTCFALRGFNYQAADARPYALATLVTSACLWFLVCWLDHGRFPDGLLFTLCAALLWRVHLILWPLYLLFACYAAFRLWRRDSAAPWHHLGLGFAILGLALLPVLAQAIALNQEAQAHTIVPKPPLSALVASPKLSMVGGYCAVVALLARWRNWPRTEPATRWALILGWWLCCPLALFAYSWITGNSVFVPRYLSAALPGIAFAAAGVVALFVPDRHWKPVTLATGIAVLLLMGQWNRLLPAHHNSDWRRASATLAAQHLPAGTPVLCPSPFIEAKPPVWHADYPQPSFLYSHLEFYRIPGRIVPLPFETSPEAEFAASRLTESVLTSTRAFAIYGGDRNVWFWRDWLAARPELAAWHHRHLGPFGDVEVVIFER